MKKILVLLSFILMSCTFSFKNSEANDYNSATAIFLITEKLKGTNLDEGAIMNAETQRLIHKMSLDIISGSTIDFKKELIGETFVINNPKASASCGCGLSFSV